MKRIEFGIAVVLVCISVFSCTENEGNYDICSSKVGDGSFEVLKSYVLDTRESQYRSYSNHIIESDSGLFIASYDRQTMTINYFNLNTGDIQFKTTLSDEGVNPIVEPSAFYYHNADSIFIARFGYFQVYLMDIKGKVINRWDFMNEIAPDSLNYNGSLSGSFGIGGIDQYGINLSYRPENQELIAHANLVVTDGDNSFPYTYELPVLASFNLKEGLVSRFFGRYPNSYLEDEIPHDLFLSISQNEIKTVVSFPSSHSLVVVDSDSTYEVCARSKYSKPSEMIYYSKADGGEVEDFWDQYISSASYDRIIYDQYRNLYYRLVKHFIPLKNLEGLRNEREASPWSILVLNEQLDPLHEVKFESKAYDFSNIHVVKEGVLISRSNILSPKFSEDEIIFDLVEFN